MLYTRPLAALIAELQKLPGIGHKSAQRLAFHLIKQPQADIDSLAIPLGGLDAATELTADFQRFITETAWGSVWTRPGLDRRSRSMITLTALIARGHHEEFAMHVRAALRNGLTREEIGEVILQSAIYCGVPDANTAFRIAQGVLDEEPEGPAEA